jgi:hypothetical protein
VAATVLQDFSGRRPTSLQVYINPQSNRHVTPLGSTIPIRGRRAHMLWYSLRYDFANAAAVAALAVLPLLTLA